MVSFPDEFRTSLESYRGPLDLLLYLIKKEEVDIFDIPISRVLDQYMEYLSVLRDIDVNLCGDFLVMAGTLMEIKSRMLLPSPPPLEGEEEEDDEDPRLELVRQLLEYKKFKDRAMLLEERLRRRRQQYTRSPTPVETDAEPTLDLGDVSLWDLVTAFARVQKSIGANLPRRIVYQDRPIEEYIALIHQRFRNRQTDRLRFDELFDVPDRFEIVGVFLALLEMARQRALRLRQERAFGEITVELRQVA